MALIPLGLGRFADGPDTRREINAMRHHNSVFHERVEGTCRGMSLTGLVGASMERIGGFVG